jgi:hypothetical protein
MKKVAAFLTLALLAGTVLAPTVQAGKKKKAKGPKVVAKDAEGDWGENSAIGSDGAAIGDALGQDLVEGLIEMADKETVNFILKLTSLPAFGGWPEVTRYVWGLTVDGEYVELDGKYTNYSRGACDPTSGQCPPPRDPGQQPFLVRGNCTQVESVTTCEEIGVVQAEFNPEEASITIPVSLEMLGAKRGSKIVLGTSEFASGAGGPILAMPSAFFTNASMPLDAMQMEGTFKVPKK